MKANITIILPIVVLLGINVLLRIPSLIEPAYSDDEHFYLTLGRAMGNGKVLYRDITDITLVRPPLIYVIASIFQTQFSFRMLALAMTCLTIVVFYKFVFILSRSLRITALITLMLILSLSTPIMGGNIPYNELFTGTFSIISAYLVYQQIRNPCRNYRRAGLVVCAAGIIAGISCLIKLHATFDVFSIGLSLAAYGGLSLFILFAAGAFIPLIASGAVLLYQGVSYDMLYILLIRGLHFIAGNNQPLFWANIIGSLSHKLMLLAITSAILLAVKKHLTAGVFMISLWSISALISSLLLNYIGLHYTLQLTIPLFLSVSLCLSEYLKLHRRIAFLPVLVFLSAHMLFDIAYDIQFMPRYLASVKYLFNKIAVEEYRNFFGPQVNRNYRVADYLRMHTHPKDTVFIWGIYSEIYSLSNTLPATALVWNEHIDSWQLYKETVEQLESTKPSYAITFEEDKVKMDALLADYMNRTYYLVKEISGSTSNSRAFIYRRQAAD